MCFLSVVSAFCYQLTMKHTNIPFLLTCILFLLFQLSAPRSGIHRFLSGLTSTSSHHQLTWKLLIALSHEVLVNDGTNKESYITIHTERLINRSDPVEYRQPFSFVFLLIIWKRYTKVLVLQFSAGIALTNQHIWLWLIKATIQLKFGEKETQWAGHFAECVEAYYCLYFSGYLLRTKVGLLNSMLITVFYHWTAALLIYLCI